MLKTCLDNQTSQSFNKIRVNNRVCIHLIELEHQFSGRIKTSKCVFENPADTVCL